MRVALVGANWGLNHLAAWRAVPGVEVSAICTAHRETAEKVATENNIPKAYWDAARMLDNEPLDLVDVIVRPSVRVPIVYAALQSKKSVLQPLPFALNLAQGRELTDLVNSNAVYANVEALHRFSPAFMQAKALIEGGFLGELYSVEAAVRTGILIDPPPGYVYEWITKATNSSSALRNFGAHLLHCLLWLFGDVERVTAYNATMERELHFTDGSTSPNETSDMSAVLLHYASGAMGTLQTSWSTPAAEGLSIDAVGSGGRLVLRADRLGPQNAILLTAKRNDSHLTAAKIDDRFFALAGTLKVDAYAGRAYPLASMCYHLAQTISGNGSPPSGPTFADAYRVMQIVEAAYEASDKHIWVQV